MEDSHKKELERMMKNASLKRGLLLLIASKHARRRKNYNIAAGILSLSSAATITSLITDLTSTDTTKIIAVLLSTASGIISLLLSTELKDSELSECYTGASGYLAMRESANLSLLTPEINSEKMLVTIQVLHATYAELDKRYMKIISDNRPELFVESTAPPFFE